MEIIYNSSKVNYSVCGEGEVLLLLHGWGGSKQSLMCFENAFKQKFKVINLDFPPFGESENLLYPWTVLDYYNAVKLILQKEGVKKVNVIAHSFGGRIALLLASEGYVNKMVLISSAGIREKRVSTFFKVKFYKLKKWLCRAGLLKEKYLNNSGSEDYKCLNDVMKKTFSNVVCYDERKILKKIKCSSLLLWGEQDDQTTLKAAQILKRGLNATLVTFKGGHFVYTERFNEFVIIIDYFLKEWAMDFFTQIDAHFYIAIILSVVNAAMMGFVGYKFLQIIQLSGYKMKGYFEWIKDTKAKYIGRIIILSALSIAGVAVTNAVFDAYTSNKYLSYLGLIFYFYFCYVFIKNMYDVPKKTPLKNTRRMNRLTACVVILFAALTFILIAVMTEYFSLLRYGIVSITPIFLPVLVPLAYYIMWPVEMVVKAIYVHKAKKVLKKMPALIKIGITGSYAKTSCKYILNNFLKKRYSVCMSPHSFNTPMGLTKVINNYLEPYNEVLIAEMGATDVGDIRELCDFISPTYGIITAASSQHLQTFKTHENILKTKFELAECIEKNFGYCVFNGDNEGSKSLYEKAKCKKSFTSVDDENACVHAKNVKLSSTGMTFTLVTEDGIEKNCKTRLIGKHNLENIVMCVALALKLKVNIDDIAEAIEELECIPHRLEILKRDNVIILDDTFNASVEGSKCALETLALFEGRKLIFTPGLIELGSMEKEANIEFGKLMAKSCDIAVIINHANEEALRQGLLEGGMKEENIIFSEDMQHAILEMKKLITDGDVVLLENDLPDNYT